MVCLVCLLWFGYRKTGAAMPSSSQMAITVRMRKGDATNKMTKLTRISNVLFMASWKRDCLNPLDVTSHAGWMISIRIWPVSLSKKNKITMVSTLFNLELTSSVTGMSWFVSLMAMTISSTSHWRKYFYSEGSRWINFELLTRIVWCSKGMYPTTSKPRQSTFRRNFLLICDAV